MIIWILHWSYTHVRVQMGLEWSWSCWWAYTCCMWCVASISCGCAPLVRVTRVVALVAHHYRRSSFCFVHVVPNPRILPSSNTLAQLRIWIWYVHNIFFGVLSKRTLHEVILNCSVPNVLNRFSWPVKYPLELQRSSSSLRLRHLPISSLT
jgi:hypothetical protein